MHKCTFIAFTGTPSLCETKKNILLIGSESCNKRSFIDSLANHALGVTREDNFNVGVTTKNTEPQMIDVYTIPSTTNTRMHFTCNVLDLPDFTAKQSDQDVDSVLDRLSKLLKNPLVHGIDSIHAIVLLFHPEDQKLLSLYQHTHQYLIKLFGCEIEDKTFNLLSGKSAECNSYASLESMMTKAGIPQKVNYPFYCGTYYQDNSSLPKAELEQQGSEMEKSLDDFLGRLEAVKPQSLTLSHENLDKRTMATEGLQQLHSVIRVGLQQIQNVKTKKEQIKNEAKGCTYISEVKEFKYSIYRTNKIKRDLAYQGEAVTNCSVCFVTCHDHCEIEEDAGKADCCVMYDGYCTQCPGKCYWDQHFNRAFIVLVKVHKSEARFSEIPTRYNLNQSSKVSDLLNALNSDIRASEENVMENMKKTIHNTRVIHEISGKTSQTPAGNILEEIILGEKRDEVDGWKERIALLQLLKQRVEMELKMESIGNSKKQQ